MVTPLQPSFARGEITELALGRVDIAAYRIGLERALNWIVTPFGSLVRRPGTTFILPTKTDQEARVIDFHVRDDQAYVLEFTPGVMRVFRNRAAVESTPGTILEVATPFTTIEQIRAMHVEQWVDVMYVAAGPDVPPQKISRLADNNWTVAAVSFTGPPAEWVAGNYPRTVTIFEQRLCWAAPPLQPRTIWLSKQGEANFENLTIGTADEDAMKLALAGGKDNTIVWLAEDDALLVGTTQQTRAISGIGTDTPLTPTSIKQKRQSSDGCAAIQPLRTGDFTLFAGRFATKLRELVFSFDLNRRTSPDRSLLGEHLLLPGIVQMAFQKEPYGVVWIVLADGTLAAFTYLPEQQVFAWSPQEIAGGKTTPVGFVESVAVIPGAGYDEVWLVVRREIDGQTRRYVEVVEPFYRAARDGDTRAAHYVDAGLLYEGPPVTTLTNITHLERETVAVHSEGAVAPDAQVFGNKLTLANERTTTHARVGLRQTAIGQTLRPDVGAPDGSAMGRKKRVSAVVVDVLDEFNLKIGPELDTLSPLAVRKMDDPMGAPPALNTGETEVTVSDRWNRQGQMYFVADTTMPATVRGIVLNLEVQT